jgi:hypothetical protein
VLFFRRSVVVEPSVRANLNPLVLVYCCDIYFEMRDNDLPVGGVCGVQCLIDRPSGVRCAVCGIVCGVRCAVCCFLQASEMHAACGKETFASDGSHSNPDCNCTGGTGVLPSKWVIPTASATRIGMMPTWLPSVADYILGATPAHVAAVHQSYAWQPSSR